MSQTRTLFPGGMGPEGFVSCFDFLLPDSLLRRKLILKGGPGVGKSTFMRRLHASLCKNDEPSTLYCCSGDPDSLDAVAVPHAGLLILDGTAPHIVDPAIPGARDSIINLGSFLDEAALRPRLAHIRACMNDHAACISRARTEMQAAWVLRRRCADTLAASADAGMTARMTRALIAAAFCDAPAGEAAPSVRPVIANAVTPKGELCLLREQPYRRVIRLSCRPGMDLTPVLHTVRHAALERCVSAEEYRSPASPGTLLHLALPSLSTLITTSELPQAEQCFDFGACIAGAALLRCDCALEQMLSSAALHTQRAVQALAQAKQIHDELESFYVPCMDFALWQKTFDETLASLDSSSDG